MRANLVGCSVVSAITQTPASGPDAPTTVPDVGGADRYGLLRIRRGGVAFGSAIKPASIEDRRENSAGKIVKKAGDKSRLRGPHDVGDFGND